MTPDTCPRCGGALLKEGGWPAWCPDCEWGLPEVDPTERTGRLQRWWSQRMHARVQSTHQQLLGSDLQASGARRLVGVVLAVLVHLLTALLVLGAVWLWTTGVFVVAKVIGSGLLLAIAWEVRPRFGRAPTGEQVLTRATAPASFAVLDEVAEAVGAHSPELLVVSPEFNASVSRLSLRARRVMTIGLPLWEALGDRERVAVLGHECGHEVNGDIRSTVIVGTAIESLHRWAWLLRPDVRATRQRWRFGSRGSGSTSLFAIAEYLVPVVLLPLSLTVAALAFGLARIAARSGQRAEYRADQLAAVAAGTEATVSALDTFFAADSCMRAMLTAVGADRGADVWAVERRFLQSVTPGQWERWRRIAGRSRHRTDASHPPTLLRQEMLRSRPVVSGVQVDPEHLAAMTAELTACEPLIARQLRETV